MFASEILLRDLMRLLSQNINEEGSEHDNLNMNWTLKSARIIYMFVDERHRYHYPYLVI